MKKILLILAILLPLVFTSCGDDNDALSSREQELVGEWAIVKTSENQEDYHYVFNKERTGSRRHLEDGNVTTDIRFNWTLDGNRLTLDYTTQKLELEISITGSNKLHVRYVATGHTEDYNKVIKPEED